MPPSIKFRFSLRMRLCERKYGYLQGVILIENFWNFKGIPNTKTILTSVSNKLFLKKTIQVIPIDMSS
jgi:hypothetical protein